MTTTDKTAKTDKAVKAPTQKEIKVRIAALTDQKNAQLESKDRKGAKKTRRQIRNLKKLLTAPVAKKSTSRKANKAEVTVEVSEPAAE